ATGSSSSGLSEVVPITGASNTIYLSSIGFKVTNSAGATLKVSSYTYTTATGTAYTYTPGTGWSAGASTVAVSSGATVTINGAKVSGSNLAGYTLEVFALSSGVSVSGSVSLD
ncbi:MAG: hypothetical protein M1481_03170, partial [Candidatus Thermoplasmatota archaeon]|nr:hypothetical protein [Candidatus Thermoplasmatota archaeon]